MTDREQLVKDYLLGGMTEDARAALERAYFEDRRLFEEIVQAENELADDYARGLLSPAVRERFEQNYLSHPARRERALFAEALAAKLDRAEGGSTADARPVRVSWLEALRGRRLVWAAVFAALLFASAAALLVFQARRARTTSPIAEVVRPAPERRVEEPATQPASTPDRQPTTDNSSAEQQAARPAPTPQAQAAPALVTLTLTATGTRDAGEGPTTLSIPAHTQRVRLRLNVRDDDYARYAVVLETAGGQEVFRRGQLIPGSTRSGASLALDVPAGSLRAGDYVLTLRGVGETGEAEDVSKFLIRVERR